MEWSISIRAVVAFYSRFVIKKLVGDQLNIYRKVEDSIKSLMERKTDLKYLEFCLTNQLLQKFVNFTLYYVTAEYVEETVSFSRSLLQKEMSKTVASTSTT